MNSGFDRLEDLERQILAMSRTESPAELFKVLRDACGLVAPRGAVFLVRQGKIHGWSAFGYEPQVHTAQRNFSCGLGEGWLGTLAADPDAIGATRDGVASDPDFGQPPAAETLGSVVRIQGNPIALVVTERQADESPWYPEVSSLLVTTAQLRLELDLALRKLQGAQQTAQNEAKAAGKTETTPPAEVPTAAAEAPAEPAEAPTETTQAPAETTEAPAEPVEASPATTEATGVAPAETPQAQEQPELEAARRYARLVATDIRLYNEEAVVLGRRNGDLDRRLEEHLGRGKETFLRRHPDLGATGLDLLLEAYVQVLAAGDDKLIPPSTVR